MFRFVARALWGVPLLLLFLSFNQAKVAHDLRSTWNEGEQALAKVTEWERSNRADITYGYVSLQIPLQDGRILIKDKISLPYSLLPRLEGQRVLAVHVREGAAQEVVIDKIMPAHWLIAASQFGMSLLGAILFFVGAWWWNGHLRKQATER